MSKELGIYKIISPSKKIYIGQSVNLKHRFNSYYKLKNCSKQRRLYNSFLKYGVINHTFEILEYCELSELNNRERYYQDKYDVIGPYGLNCRLTETANKSGKLSEETRLKLKETSSKKVYDILNKVYYSSANDCGFKNNIDPDTLRRKLSGVTLNDTYFIYDKTIPMEGINYNCELIVSKDKKVIDIKTGKIYKSLVQCCSDNNLSYSTLRQKLDKTGRRKNNTNFLYLNKDIEIYYKYCKLLEKVICENLYTPFSIHDSEYIEELNKRLDNLKIKIDMESKKDYDKEPVFACKHCGTLVVPNQYEVDDDGNEICQRCNSVNDVKEYKNIFEYNKEQKIKPKY